MALPKLSPELQAQFRMLFRHPVKWVKGSDLPSERIRPWEMLAHVIPQVPQALATAFRWQRNWLFLNYYRIQPHQQIVGDTVSSIIDGITDPIVGAFMDTKNFKIDKLRWIWRVGIVLGPIFEILPMINFGLSAWQRIILIICLQPFRDVLGTPGAVASEKIWAHITDSSLERYRISWAQGIGVAIHEMIVPLGLLVVGLRDQLNLSAYIIIVAGMATFTVPAVICNQAPTFVRQRVPDKIQPKSKDELTVKAYLHNIWECFQITRHNRFFWLDNFAALANAMLPTITAENFARFGNITDQLPFEVQGEAWVWVRDNIASIPMNFVGVPLALPIIKKVGGPRNLQMMHEGISVVCNTARALVGVNTFGGVMFHTGMETAIRTFGRVNGIAHRINEFEMLDYVEWKTGRRSEGATMAINGLKRKLITNNINAASGNLFAQIFLGFDPELGGHGELYPADHPLAGQPMPGQPQRYLTWMPRMFLWLPILANVFLFLARLLYRYPAELRDQVEADLIERRRLAAEAKAAMEAEMAMFN
jgi:Na+/melibiose symporter-like transporter